MGRKTKNLNALVDNKINVHEYKEIDNLVDLIDYSTYNSKFSIRFDSKEIIHNLPFYTYDKEVIDKKEEYFQNIINKMNELNCTLLVSNGYNFDNKIKFNFVIEVSDDLSFILELSDKKIPLRDMYKEKTTIIKGNLMSDIKEYQYINKLDNTYKDEDIEYIINWIISLNKRYTYIEGTLYTEKVGIYNEYLIIWQSD